MRITEIPSEIGIKERVTPSHVYFLRGPLSQWFHSPFKAQPFMAEVMGYASFFYEFNTCEHYMMYNKALYMGDVECAGRILKAETPKEAKNIGREVKNYDDVLWDAIRFHVVVRANYLKFNSPFTNPKLREYLKKTESRIIVEANPEDSIWGVALSETDDRILDESQWRGRNLLGKALMMARDESLMLTTEYQAEYNKLEAITSPCVERLRMSNRGKKSVV
jgi:hypothetical protein